LWLLIGQHGSWVMRGSKDRFKPVWVSEAGGHWPVHLAYQEIPSQGTVQKGWGQWLGHAWRDKKTKCRSSTQNRTPRVVQGESNIFGISMTGRKLNFYKRQFSHLMQEVMHCLSTTSRIPHELVLET
jgi:hypothetical protein